MKNEDKQALYFWYGVIGAVAVVGVIVIGSLRPVAKQPLQDDASVRSLHPAQVPVIDSSPDTAALMTAVVVESPAPAPVPFASQGFSPGYGSFEFKSNLPEVIRNQTKRLEKAALENSLLPEEDRSNQALTQERIQAIRESGRMIQ